MKLKSAVATLLGCAVLFGASSAMANTTIKVWCWDDNFNVPAARMAAEKYQKMHPEVTVKVESIGQPDIIQKLNASLGARNVKGLPDIVLIEDYRVQNFLVGYPDFLKDLSGTIDFSKFVDYKVAASSNNGKHFGVPFDSGVVGTFIRTDLFEKAGYKLSDLQDVTWDQFIDMGKKVKEATGVNLFGYDPSDLGVLRVMMQSAGAWYTSEDGKKVNLVGNEALKDALRIYKRMHDEGLVITYSGWNALLATFQQTQVASVVQGCWISPSIEANTDQSGKWAVIPLPKLNVKDATHYSNLGGSQWYVNNYSKNADVAADFLKTTFASDYEFANDLVTKIALVNSFKDSTKISNYNVENAFYNGQKVYADFANWNKQIPSLSYGPHTYAVESVMTEALQRVIGGEDIDKVLKDAQVNAEMQIGM